MNKAGQHQLRWSARDRLRQVIKYCGIPIPKILDQIFPSDTDEQKKGREYYRQILGGRRPLHKLPEEDIHIIARAIARFMPGDQPNAEKQKQVIDFAVNQIVPAGMNWNGVHLTSEHPGKLAVESPLNAHELASSDIDSDREGPSNARVFQISPDEAFSKVGLLKNPHRLCVGHFLSLGNLRGTEGISPSQVRVVPSDGFPDFPDFVIAHEPSVAADLKAKNENNKDKAFITSMYMPSLDENAGAVLQVSKAKYSYKKAMIDRYEELRNEFIGLRLKPIGDDPIYDDQTATALPGAFHCDAVIITGASNDRKILLAQRGAVDAHRGFWQASIGEGMEWEEAQSPDSVLSTIWRALEEEWGLSKRWVLAQFGETTGMSSVDIGFGLATSVVCLFSVIEFPNLAAQEAIGRAERYALEAGRENRRFDCMDFSPRACAETIVGGVTEGRRLNDAGRYNILLACLREFGSDFARDIEAARSVQDKRYDE